MCDENIEELARFSREAYDEYFHLYTAATTLRQKREVKRGFNTYKEAMVQYKLMQQYDSEIAVLKRTRATISMTSGRTNRSQTLTKSTGFLRRNGVDVGRIESAMDDFAEVQYDVNAANDAITNSLNVANGAMQGEDDDELMRQFMEGGRAHDRLEEADDDNLFEDDALHDASNAPLLAQASTG